jgi:hypothetical protein
VRDLVYLVFTRHNVVRMTKKTPALARGEFYTKLQFTALDGVFREPVLETSVVIEDWREGLDIGDVELKEGTITATEADMIRKAREEAMIRALADRGYTVIGPEAGENEDEPE